MRFFWGIVVGILAFFVIGIITMYSGVYNVAASSPHTAIGRWVLHTTMEHSVEAHAEDVKAPAQLTRAMVEKGAHHFKDDCVGCHGAPGVEPHEMAKGMRPEPPELKEAAEEMSPEEIFWVVKHGIKMTGMPAWGKVDDDEELWNTVAFVKHIPEISAEQYREMTKGGEDEGESGEAR